MRKPTRHKSNRHINLKPLKFFDNTESIWIDNDNEYVRLWFNKNIFDILDAQTILYSKFLKRYLISINITWTNTIWFPRDGFGWKSEHCEDFWVWYNIKGKQR